MRRVVISGATRGLGLEFASQYLQLGDAVVAIERGPYESAPLEQLRRRWPDTLHINKFDVTSDADVARFGAEISVLPVDILINNAGQIGPETHKGEQGQSLQTLDLHWLRSLFEVNAVAPLWLTRCLLPSLRLSAQPRVVVMGSTVGCARETFGDYYAYRMSKAAVHVAFATLAKDLAAERVVSAVVCPGWVKTDLGGPTAHTEVADSVRMMIGVIETLDLARSGQFLDSGGRQLEF